MKKPCFFLSKPRLLWLESCSNPLLEMLDVKATAEAVKAKKEDVVFCVDNTVLSPYILVSFANTTLIANES